MSNGKFNFNRKRFVFLHNVKVFIPFFLFLFFIFLAYKFDYLGYPSSSEVYKQMYHDLGGKENLDNYKPKEPSKFKQ